MSSPTRWPSVGIARTFQNIELFPQMTVIDNLLTGRHVRMQSSWLAGSALARAGQAGGDGEPRKVEDIIDFLEIEQWRKYPVGLLPYGIQKRVELGRALAMDPELLLLDEPVAGMNLEETEDMARFILDIQDELGIAMILVEHDMGLVMDIADRVIVLDFGNRSPKAPPPRSNRIPTSSRRTLAKRLLPSIPEERVQGRGYSPTNFQAPGRRRPAAAALMMSPRTKGTTPATTACREGHVEEDHQPGHTEGVDDERAGDEGGEHRGEGAVLATLGHEADHTGGEDEPDQITGAALRASPCSSRPHPPRTPGAPAHRRPRIRPGRQPPESCPARRR